MCGCRCYPSGGSGPVDKSQSVPAMGPASPKSKLRKTSGDKGRQRAGGKHLENCALSCHSGLQGLGGHRVDCNTGPGTESLATVWQSRGVTEKTF